LTQIFTPNLVNELRGNFSRQTSEDRADLQETGGARTPPASLLFPAGYSSSDSTFEFAMPGPTPPPFFYLGTYARNRARQIQVLDNLTWVRGAHRLRFGGDYRRFTTERLNPRLSILTSIGDLHNPDGSLVSNYSGMLVNVHADYDVEYLVP